MYCEPRSVVRFRSLSQYPDFLRSLISTLCFNIRSRLTYTTFSYERMGGGKREGRNRKKKWKGHTRGKKRARSQKTGFVLDSGTARTVFGISLNDWLTNITLRMSCNRDIRIIYPYSMLSIYIYRS